MAKSKTKVRTSFLCDECGGVHPRWAGKCPDCGAWDSLKEFRDQPVDATDPPGWSVETDAPTARTALARPLGDVSRSDAPRISSGVPELDRVLGGGYVPGSVLLVGGDPGIGKSTLLLQSAVELAAAGRTVLYASSEESASQVRLRADRLLADLDDARRERVESLLLLCSESSLARLLEQTRQASPAFLVVDSIQLVHRDDVEAAPGSPMQLRRCCHDLVSVAKRSGIAVAMVGHVTKEGSLAGPKLLEHLVDVVLGFEGDRHHTHRLVRAIKNRFGSTQEIGLLEMTAAGLVESTEGSLRVAADAPDRVGSVLVPALAGTRCILAEIQALTAAGFLGSVKRRASGVDPNRLAVLVAVLEKHGGLRLADQDVFVSVAGGMRIVEPAADLGIALAIAGAHLNRPLAGDLAAIGEIGLSGELRPVRGGAQRVSEAARRGARMIVVPAGQGDLDAVDAPEVVRAATIAEALGRLLTG